MSERIYRLVYSESRTFKKGQVNVRAWYPDNEGMPALLHVDREYWEDDKDNPKLTVNSWQHISNMAIHEMQRLSILAFDSSIDIFEETKV